MRHQIAILLVGAVLCAMTAAAAQPKAEENWGKPAGALQARLTITNSPVKGSPIQVSAELRNNSEQPVPLGNVRVWLLIATAGNHLVYTAPFAGPAKMELGAGKTKEITFDAGPLLAYSYTNDLVIRNGLPGYLPGKKTMGAEPLGRLGEVIPIGEVKVKAFVAVTFTAIMNESEQTRVVPSSAMPVAIGLPDFSKLTPDETMHLLTVMFRGDADTAKAAHDQAMKMGKRIIPQLIAWLDDKDVSDAGRAWVTVALVEFHDEHATDGLISVLNKGGKYAYVIAYMGPRMKDAKVTAAVENVAHTSKDPILASWAARGLGLAGEKVDTALLEPLVTSGDPSARVDAAEILAGSTDSHTALLLARIINDDDAAVRIRAARSAASHHRKEADILAALKTMKDRPDAPSKQAAEEVLDQLSR